MQSLRFGAIFAIALAFGLSSNEARAVGADAGSKISNTATVDYTVGTVNSTASSNTVEVTVAEILNVAVGGPASATPVAPGQAGQRLRFRVENTGNGSEAFLLTLNSIVTGDAFDPVAAAPSIYLDNGDGVFGVGDVPYLPGTNDPLLNEDDFVYVFVAHNIPTTVADGDDGFVTLTAAARTGTGTAGTVFAGQGTLGTDAVVGTTTATQTAQGTYSVEAVTVTATKSQTVTDPFGANRPLPGATIHYSVAVNAVGSGTANTVVFTDKIPDGTDYVAGSLRRNGTPLSDATDADIGEYEATPTPSVRVRVGSLQQTDGTQTITFDVLIKTTN
jgi:uncharacterized repeat protein (TIGR01451 family)